MNSHHEHHHAHVCACHSEEKKAAGECCQDRTAAVRQVLAMAAAVQQRQGCGCGGNCRHGSTQGECA
ncbi:MAG: hypothetical protein AAB581_00750, partial [Patescibacteria group bacterium]